MRHLAAVLFSMSPIACACSSGGGPGAAAVPTGDLAPTVEVAKLDGTSITAGELDREIGGQLRDLDEQRYQVRRQGLEQLINHRLVKEAAAKRGIDEATFIRQEVETKVRAVDDAQVKKFFEDRAAQLPPGAKLEDYRDRIANYLSHQGQSERTRELFAQLREQSKVVITLMPPPKPKIEVAAVGPSRGPAKAKVTIVEFSDFQCPYCKDGRENVEKVMTKYGDRVRLVFRNYPLISIHPQARKAAEAGLCADAQGKFWPLHDAMFANQGQLALADLKAAAGKVGVDQARFDKCLDGGETSARVDRDLADAEKAGLNGAPAFFINGILLSGAQPPAEFEKVIDEALAGG